MEQQQELQVVSHSFTPIPEISMLASKGSAPLWPSDFLYMTLSEKYYYVLCGTHPMRDG